MEGRATGTAAAAERAVGSGSVGERPGREWPEGVRLRRWYTSYALVTMPRGTPWSCATCRQRKQDGAMDQEGGELVCPGGAVQGNALVTCT